MLITKLHHERLLLESQTSATMESQCPCYQKPGTEGRSILFCYLGKTNANTCWQTFHLMNKAFNRMAELQYRVFCLQQKFTSSHLAAQHKPLSVHCTNPVIGATDVNSNNIWRHQHSPLRCQLDIPPLIHKPLKHTIYH